MFFSFFCSILLTVFTVTSELPQAPEPLQAPPPRNFKVQVCICGDSCKCKEEGKVCPTGCPLTHVCDENKNKEGHKPAVICIDGKCYTHETLEKFAPPGYPRPPQGFVWVPDSRGTGGWGLLQKSLIGKDLNLQYQSPSVFPKLTCPNCYRWR